MRRKFTWPTSAALSARSSPWANPFSGLAGAGWDITTKGWGSKADVVRRKRVTSWAGLHTGLKNAGAHWEISPFVYGQGLITSRQPKDIPAFNKKAVAQMLEPRHGGQHLAVAQNNQLDTQICLLKHNFLIANAQQARWAASGAAQRACCGVRRVAADYF